MKTRYAIYSTTIVAALMLLSEIVASTADFEPYAWLLGASIVAALVFAFGVTLFTVIIGTLAWMSRPILRFLRDHDHAVPPVATHH